MKKSKQIVAVLVAFQLMFVMIAAFATSTSAATPFYGDVDGNNKIGLGDAITIQMNISGSTQLTSEQKILANVNGDSKVSLLDVILVQLHCAGSIDTFPVEQQTNTTTEPTTKPTTEPTTKPTTEPTTKPTTEPTTGKPVTENPTDNEGWIEKVVRP